MFQVGASYNAGRADTHARRRRAVRYQDGSGPIFPQRRQHGVAGAVFAHRTRVLKDGVACLSFYAWNTIEFFRAAWRKAGLRPFGHVVFPKTYAPAVRFTEYRRASVSAGTAFAHGRVAV